MDTIISSDGNTSTEAEKAIIIIIEVINPYDENNGIGAWDITKKPPIDDAADAAKAIPVPLVENLRASNLFEFFKLKLH